MIRRREKKRGIWRRHRTKRYVGGRCMGRITRRGEKLERSFLFVCPSRTPINLGRILIYQVHSQALAQDVT